MLPADRVDKESKAWKLNDFNSAWANAVPLTELPYSSSRGENVAKPPTFGITHMLIPDTPLLAGSPVLA